MENYLRNNVVVVGIEKSAKRVNYTPGYLPIGIRAMWQAHPCWKLIKARKLYSLDLL